MRQLRLFLVSLGLRNTDFPVITPPLGILALAAYLRTRFNLEIKVLDQRLGNTPCDEIARMAAEFKADIVGFGCLTPFAYLLPEVVRNVRESLPGALVVLGGPHAAAYGADALEMAGGDVLVAGEGELALEQVIQAHLGGSGFDHIPGLFWRNESGIIEENPGSMPLIEDLDSLPFLAYDLIDLPQYWRFEGMANVPPRKYIGLFSSRGCPYRCSYCHRIFGKRFRSQSPERIVAAIEHLQRIYGVHEIEFYDDVFNQDRARVIKFSEMAAQHNLQLKIAFPNGIRCDRLGTEMVDALMDAGMYYTCCPLESGSPRIQEFIHKNLDIPRFIEGVEDLVRRRVFTYGYAMLGFPTETEEEIEQTIDVMCSTPVHLASFFTVTPFPNTEIYDMVKEAHPERLDGVVYRSYPGNKINLSEVPDSVLYAHQRKAMRRFYLNPARVVRLLRDYPKPLFLGTYLPIAARQMAKGILT